MQEGVTINIAEKIYGSQGNPDVLNLIPRNVKYVLDVGCGTGSLANSLKQRGCVVDGISISDEELEQAGPFLRRGYLQNLELGLPQEISSRYDVVVCSHVLEHICYPDKLLSDINDVLVDNGQLIIALPNIMHYKARIQLALGNFNYQTQGLWDYTHFRWYTFRSAKKLIETHGFVVEHATVTGELPFNSVFAKILPASLRKKMFGVLKSISKGFFGYQLLYRALHWHLVSILGENVAFLTSETFF